jgi:hypothetical protein
MRFLKTLALILSLSSTLAYAELKEPPETVMKSFNATAVKLKTDIRMSAMQACKGTAPKICMNKTTGNVGAMVTSQNDNPKATEAVMFMFAKDTKPEYFFKSWAVAVNTWASGASEEAKIALLQKLAKGMSEAGGYTEVLNGTKFSMSKASEAGIFFIVIVPN